MSIEEPTALGAHIYAGTHTIGTQRHFKVLAHFEAGYKAGIETAKLNWPDMPIHDGPPWPTSDYAGKVDYVYCNPPCSIFSAAGIRTTRGADAWRTDPRRGCWYDVFSLIDSIKPRALSIESVCQAYTTGREMIDEFTKLALIRGYSVTHVMINAMWLGVPQKRRRFFFVAHRPNGLVYRIPNWAPPMTVGEALAEALTGEEPITELLEKHREALRITEPGEGLREAWERLNPPETHARNNHGEVIGRPSFNEGRLNAECPMGALIGNFLFHPTEDRRLTSSELKALCGVPEDFKLWGPTSHWASLLARGVMPAVASWLGEAVKTTLNYPDGDWRDRTVKLVDLRDPGREVIDLTSDYLDENGRVRMRVPAGRTSEPPMPEYLQPRIIVHRPAERQENTNSTRFLPVYSRTGAAIGSGGVCAEPPIQTRRFAEVRQAADLTNVDQGERCDSGIASGPIDPDLPDGSMSDSLIKPSDLASGCTPQLRQSAPPNLSQQAFPEMPGRSSSREDTVIAGLQAGVNAEMRVQIPSDSDATPPNLEVYGDVLKPLPGEGSGRFMQRLWLKTELTPEEIVALVHANWQGRTTKISDMYYNYNKLRQAGAVVRSWPTKRNEKGPRRAVDLTPVEDDGQACGGETDVATSVTRAEPVGQPPGSSAGVAFRDPAEDRVGPDDAGRSESQTLRADEGPVATSRSSAGVINDEDNDLGVEEERVPRTRDALPKTFKSLADRSGVVPGKGPPLDVALVYLSAMPSPEEKPNPVSSVRMAWFLKEELKPDVCYNQNQYPTDFLPSRIGELWVVNSSWTWMQDSWRRISMRLFDRADRIIFCQNDYTMYLHSYHMGRIREDANYVVLSTCKDVPLHVKHGHRSELVNWNVLTYAPRPETDVERRDGIYYYGSFRKGRHRIFDRYFKQSNGLLTVSASNGTEVKKFKTAYPDLNVVPRAENVFEELERWQATLMLEDERSANLYVSPPNRFYESLSSRCPMIFDKSSVPTFAKYGYDIRPFVIDRPSQLSDALAREHLFEQSSWNRDYISELRDQLHTAIIKLRRGECGRIGAPPGLKRYSFTEEGGDR